MPYIEFIYCTGNWSILEILGYSVVSLKYWDTVFGGEELLRGVFNYYLILIIMFHNQNLHP
jgi:hypothetical protein